MALRIFRKIASVISVVIIIFLMIALLNIKNWRQEKTRDLVQHRIKIYMMTLNHYVSLYEQDVGTKCKDFTALQKLYSAPEPPFPYRIVFSQDRSKGLVAQAVSDSAGYDVVSLYESGSVKIDLLSSR